MVNIDLEKCDVCGICTRICHESCMFIENKTLHIKYEHCSTCTQCISICPKLALSWDGHQPEPFDKSVYPTPAQMSELFKERRTIRDYKKEKIDKALLEEITSYAIYAPTHDFHLRAIIIDSDYLIDCIDTAIYNFSVRMYKWFFKYSFIFTILKIFVPAQKDEYLKAKPKLENAFKRKRGFKTRPAAIIMIIGKKNVPLSLESAQYAIYNIDLYAQTKGLACRSLVGNQFVLNRNKKLKNKLGLSKKEMIYGTLTIGYPAIKFRNKVFGKKISVQWNQNRN
jgi:nitroreductase/NAD-dependent dihydropyrimidine dehydrogenase PreA subunit